MVDRVNLFCDRNKVAILYIYSAILHESKRRLHFLFQLIDCKRHSKQPECRLAGEENEKINFLRQPTAFAGNQISGYPCHLSSSSGYNYQASSLDRKE